jgi:N-acylneuraminate cytidylyltransferase
MFSQKKILAVIPARGGSKGVPGKNIRPAGGKPLIAWIIEAAKKSKYIDRLILSSDDRDIIDVSVKHGCEAPFVRPPELARDESSVSDVIVHALNNITGYDFVLLLQPTSPLTLTQDIDGFIKSCINSGARSMVSVTESDKSPYWMFHMDNDSRLCFILGQNHLNARRQDLPQAYIPTGAIYMAQAAWFLENRSFYSDSTIGYVIPKDRSLDIDSELDFKFLELILEKG